MATAGILQIYLLINSLKEEPMNNNQFGRDQRDYIRFRESDSSDDWTKKQNHSQTNGTFSQSSRKSFEHDLHHENHAGKGPRGYKRSDEKIKEEASELLMNDHDLDASDIEIELQDRCLILKGEVISRRDKRLAEDLVENISGIDDVQNQLRIKKPKVEGWIPGLDSLDDSGGQNG